MRNYPMIVISSGTHWFKEVRKRWTTLNSWEITLWSLFPLELSGSVRGSQRFSKVEPPCSYPPSLNPGLNFLFLLESIMTRLTSKPCTCTFPDHCTVWEQDCICVINCERDVDTRDLVSCPARKIYSTAVRFKAVIWLVFIRVGLGVNLGCC